MMQVLAIFIGGGLGSLMRYFTGKFAQLLFPGFSFPLGTFMANVLSCVLFALLLWLMPSKMLEGGWQRSFFIIGLCGGYSTFSTFSYETLQLIRQNHHVWAMVNVLSSVVLCVLIFWLLSKK